VVVTPPVDGETRYRYLETVRHFALERLAGAGEEPALRDRHLDHFLAVAEESQTHLAGAEQKHWLNRLDVEHSDLLAAHAWCGEDDQRAVKGLRLVGALWGYWSARGHYAVAGRTLLEALARPGAQARVDARAVALVRAGAYALSRADHDAAFPLVEESLSISRELKDRQGVARCLSALATIAIFTGSLEEARKLGLESLALYRELGRVRGVANVLHNLGHVALYQGKLDEAHLRYEEALQALAATGDERQIAQTLSDFGRVATRRGEGETARIRFATALQLARGLGARREAAYALEGVAEVAAETGELAMAAQLLGAAMALRDVLGSPMTAAESAEQMGFLARLRSEMGERGLDERLGAGRSRGFEAAVEHALHWLEGTRGTSAEAGPGVPDPEKARFGVNSS